MNFKFKKTILSLVAVLLLITLSMGLMVACGPSSDESKDSDSESASQSSSNGSNDTSDPSNDTGKVEVPETDDTVANIIVLNGTTGMGAANMMKDADPQFKFEIASAADVVSAAMIGGDADIAAVPTNLAAVLYNKTGGKVKAAAINTKGVLYILENGSSITSFESLKGKTVYVPGLGSNPEYLLKYLCAKNGLEVGKDITIDGTTYPSPDELTTAVVSGKADIALLPEPKVTVIKSKNANINVALDITAEWEKACGKENTLVQGCIIVKTEFAEAHPLVIEKFLTQYEASIEKISTDTETSAANMAELGILPSKEVALKAIPGCNICYMEGEEMKTALSYLFGALYEIEPKSVGGAVPDDGVYYSRSK